MVTVFVVRTYDPRRKGTQSAWFLTAAAAEAFASDKRCYAAPAKDEPRAVTEAEAAKFARAS